MFILEDKARLYWIDNLKGYGMAAIILGHCLFPQNSILPKYLFTFHVPLFFFMSGLLFNETKYNKLSVLAKDRFKRLIIPFFWFNFIVYLSFVLSSVVSPRDLMSPFDFITITLRANYIGTDSPYNIINNPVWFLPCLFLVSIIYFFINKHVRKTAVKIGIMFALSIAIYIESKMTSVRIPWSLDVALMATLFYGLGHTFKDKIMTLVSKAHIRHAWLLPVIILANFFLLNPTNMSMNSYGNYAMFLIAAFLGISSSLIFVVIIGKNNVFGFIGRNSIIFNGMEWIKAPMIKVVAALSVGMVSAQPSNLTAIVQAILCIALIFPISMAISRYFPFILGDKWKARKPVETQVKLGPL